MPGGQDGPPWRGGQGVRRAEKAGHGRGGKDEAGGSSLPRCPHKGEGALGPWSIDMGALLAGHGRGGKDEAGGSSLPRCPHKGEGALGPWSIDMGALLACDES